MLTIEHFYNNNGRIAVQNRRWRMGVHKLFFTLRNMQDAPDPEEMLMELFIHFVEIAQGDEQADKFSVIMFSPNWRKPLFLPYRTSDQNTPDAFINEFRKKVRSGDGIDVFGAPLTIEVVVGPFDGLIQGRGRKRRLVVDNVVQGSLIQVR